MAFLKRKQSSNLVTELADKSSPEPLLDLVADMPETVLATPVEDQGSSNEPIAKAKELVLAELSKGANISVISLVGALIGHALSLKASDIHLDPNPDNLVVRFRVDGVMRMAHKVDKNSTAEIIARIKVLAQLRTDEHQAAQDGRFRVTEAGSSVDVRVSVVPTYYGENAVLRLLANQSVDFTLDSLGFSKANQKKIIHATKKSYGMIVVTGPTGSGKTTTLYTLMRMLHSPDVSIITIEDPIEYAIPGIVQIQANARTGLTFANGLRSMLRQDPNIIMVGEVRDSETAGIAVNTALTGHLVLTTLHTNDSATTLPRLLDMKIESYLIASTVSIAIGQRLVRKICEYCKKEKELSVAEHASLLSAIPNLAMRPGEKLFSGAGCERCRGSGFSGRVGIHEVLVVDGLIRDAVLKKASAAELRTLAAAQGMTTLVEDGLAKAAAGLTTVEEILRVLYE